MRIVQAVLSLEIGGQERLILNLSRALRARGHDVRVLSLSLGGALRPEFGDIPLIDVPRRPGFHPSLVARLAWALARVRPDVLHTHNDTPLVYAAPAARLVGVRRVVHTKHGDKTLPRATLALARAATRLVGAFCAVSEQTAQAARRTERPREHTLRVVTNGVPLDAFGRTPERRSRARDALAIPHDAVVLGSVGRLVREKDYPALVRAAGPLLSERVRLVIVGDGPERGPIESAVVNLGPAAPYVTLTGARTDVPDLLAGFDVFALSSRTEGLPLVVAEAMASSLPVIATTVGGLPSAVLEGTGALVPPGNEPALRDALRARVTDTALRAAEGERARSHALARFGLDAMADAYERAYDDAD